MSNEYETYKGYELGSVRPPSERGSLLLRVTRSCPWNRCRFCSLYKGERFGIRPAAHIKRDIDLVKYYYEALADAYAENGSRYRALKSISTDIEEDERMALFIADSWLQGGGDSVFLQDANSVIMKPEELAETLSYLRGAFPKIKKITSYARSQTVSSMNESQLSMLKEAGLNRLHIGMESGCDKVLSFISKGVTKEDHIKAGRMVKKAGIELSMYYMPGLGGVDYSEENALESAEVINRTNPDYIRLRTLAVPDSTELFKSVISGEFKMCSDRETAQEILLFIENLSDVESFVVSDHILNLLQEVEGRLPHDRDKMTGVIRRFFDLPRDEQMLFITGRRSGVFTGLNDLSEPYLRENALKTMKAHNVTKETLDSFCETMTSGYI